ncbi:MAG: general secretion pathway protein GspK [Thermoguttaceae bacterium]|nr:general secretion pathway protein GspK [Thermoguttaceae bacterium]MDW8078286.1 type II secretion system protein GspK [Thermoguttaceae bacterium]
MVLVLVLAVVPVLSLVALTYSELMLTEYEAAIISGRRGQAREIALSGLDAVRMFLTLDADTQAQAGGSYDNPSLWSEKIVVDDSDPRGRGRFTIIAPNLQDGDYAGVRHGIQDESTRLNLNALLVIEQRFPGAGRQLLMALPGMTEDVADAILDWIDSDDEPREFGCEAEYYLSLDPPYQPKNGPLETIEELLLVRGVTPELLFGADTNRNGVLDSGDADPTSLAELQGLGEEAYLGWASYLTLWSMELNLKPDGTPKIYVNKDDLETLYSEIEEVLGSTWATFIVAYRQQQQSNESGGAGSQENNPQNDQQEGDDEGGGRSGGSSSTQVETEPSGEIDFTRPARTRIRTILDLIGAQVRVQYADQEETKTLASPCPNEPGAIATQLPLLMENLTAVDSPVLFGRININLAPRAVLRGIPGMSDEIVEEIIARRPQDPSQADILYRYETWILCEGIVTLEEMKTLMPFICAGGCIYRVQVVGYYDGGGPFSRLEAILDASKLPPRILFWRDLSHLGLGWTPQGASAGFIGWSGASGWDRTINRY